MKEYERAVIFRLGRLRSGGAKGPGIFFIVPCIDSYKKLDLRTVSFDVPPQEVIIQNIRTQLVMADMQVLSRDSVTVSVDAVVYYRVSNPTMVMMKVLMIVTILVLFRPPIISRITPTQPDSWLPPH